MRIYAPVKNANGVWCNVLFKNGVGETDNPHLIEWFRKHGYKIEDLRIEQTAITPSDECLDGLLRDVEKVAQPNFDDMSPNELREWAKEHGFGLKIKNIRNKEKLLEIIRG